MKKIILVFLLLCPVTVSAHSVISPSQTLVSKYETFSLSVPTEKDVPTVAIRLVIPAGLDRVTPFVKSGWRIEAATNAEGEVTEIMWSGNSIPARQKDEFKFTARTSPEPTTLIWKAYQTYQGGEVVSWDMDPVMEHEEEEGEEQAPHTPYSTTEVTIDSAAAPREKPLTDVLAWGAFGFSLVALLVSFRRRS